MDPKAPAPNIPLVRETSEDSSVRRVWPVLEQTSGLCSILDCDTYLLCRTLE